MGHYQAVQSLQNHHLEVPNHVEVDPLAHLEVPWDQIHWGVQNLRDLSYLGEVQIHPLGDPLA